MATIAIVISGPEFGETSSQVTVKDTDAQRIIAAQMAILGIEDPQAAIVETARRVISDLLQRTKKYEIQRAIVAAEQAVSDIEVGDASE